MMMVGGSDEVVRDFKPTLRDNRKVGFRFRESFFNHLRTLHFDRLSGSRERFRD
jgi:hypothetical protein